MKLIFTLVTISFLLLGCGAAPVKRFPAFYDPDNHPKKVSLITDTLVTSDISGTKVGINPVKNNQAIANITKSIVENLNSRGYQIEHAFHGNGIIFDFSKKQDKFVISEDRQSTGEQFEILVGKGDNPWLSSESQAFLRRLLSRSRAANFKVYSKKFLVDKITPEEIPQFVKELPSNYLVFVNTHAFDIGKGKSIGIGILTGALSFAASGGTLIYSSTAISGSNVDIAVFDIERAKVLWHVGTNDKTGTMPHGRKFEEIDETIDHMLLHFPMADSSRYIPPKPENKKPVKRRR